MKKLLIALILLPLMATATQWGSRTLAPGLNNAQDNYPACIKNNGGVYEITSYELYYHSYSGNYQWGSRQKCTIPTLISSITIDPNQHKAIVVDDNNNIRWANSSNGLNWSWGTILSAWERSGQRPTSVSCAWNGPNKWLYVAYNDGIVWGAPYPYSNPQVINVGGTCKYVAVRPQTGDYLIVQGWNGSNRDLYELKGFGSSWGSRTNISEVNSGNDEYSPVLGVISQEHENLLLWSTAGSVGGNDIYYSTGNDTSAVTPTSLGRVKAMFH